MVKLFINLAKLFTFLCLFQGRYAAYLRFRGLIMRFLADNGIYDPNEIALLKKFVSKGDSVVDAGAHLGVYTKHLLSLVGVAGTVYAFEPQTDLATILEQEFKIHPAFRLLKKGLSDCHERVPMRLPKLFGILPEAALANVTENRIQSNFKNRVDSIELVTLDAQVPIGVRISFIKADVEGNEIALIRGAQRVIRDSAPVIQVEINDLSTSWQ
jgi:FkbM family methyltransferase